MDYTPQPKKPRAQSTAFALMYALALPGLRDVAFRHGYALAIHGSMSTDIDLVAVPWVDDADSAEVLIEAIKVSVNGHERHPEWCDDTNPSLRSHGRRCWSIYLTENSGAPYLDISVMPRIETQACQGTAPLLAGSTTGA